MSDAQRITVLVDEPIATISPYLHGTFAEHLGGCIYPGIWVGEESAIANTRGLRNDVIVALRHLQIPVTRWPGGCFADHYHWRDGIGPRAERPLRVNDQWGSVAEPNTFGTHEFIDLCRLIGTEPYIVGNVGSGTPGELHDWVEYCNFGGRSALADERGANGAADPFNVRFWGIGNENWACGGTMSAEHYAEEFCRFRTFVKSYADTNVHAVACGPNSKDWSWTQRFFERVARYCDGHDRSPMLDSFAGHYYCGTAGEAAQYSDAQWLELLAKARAIEGLICGHRQIMDDYDPQRRIHFIIDEWGTWHDGEDSDPLYMLYRQNTMRDALACALTLDVFHNHSDKIWMGNIAQTINVLQAALLVMDDQCVKTPTYHAFDLYRPHQGGQALRTVNAGESISDGGASAEHCRDMYRDNSGFSLKVIEGSASVTGDTLCATVVNTDPNKPVELALSLVGAKLGNVDTVTLAGADIHAHNTFEAPDTVTLAESKAVAVRGTELRIALPAASATRVIGPLR
ncbi:MAG: alpha-N-arabinofuranosidase [Planctomycetaceae bacterium]|nr:alpha-N-arabinofuranosidase [Planctomycetaceae bacterium]